MPNYGEFTHTTTIEGPTADGGIDDIPVEIELRCVEPSHRGDIWLGEQGTDPEFNVQSVRLDGAIVDLSRVSSVFGDECFAKLVEEAEHAAIESGEF